MKAPLVVLVDTREQRPLVFPPEVETRAATLGEGDYAVLGIERFARIERKSSADLWNTVHGDHDRFNLELSRLRDYARAAVLVDDAWREEDVAERAGASQKAFERLLDLTFAIEWKACIPIIWGGTRERAAKIVVKAFKMAVEDYGRLARCEEIARLAGPYSSAAGLRAAALAALFGICVDCGKRPGPRPKPPGKGVCKCGRLEANR